MVLGADLATPADAGVNVPRVPPGFSSDLEMTIDALESELPPLTNFILPAGSPAAAAIHVARTVCRRAERLVAGLLAEEVATPETLVFLNRLSDFLFVAARWVNLDEEIDDVIWSGTS